MDGGCEAGMDEQSDRFHETGAKHKGSVAAMPLRVSQKNSVLRMQ